MAVNKRKVLDAARKYAQKGAKEKALKEYHTLLKLDPRDAKLHLEIGDCYRRWGQIDEAITQYARVADQYKNDGFDARSVAVFKQILNLDPKRYTAYVSLAELYQRMGLDSEALSSLQAAADGYHKEGNKPAALDLLRKMATLDPTNTTSRLKVAELLRQEGMQDDAVAEYQEVVAELDRQGAPEQAVPVLERILELRPDRADLLIDLARKLIAVRTPERAEPFARLAVKQDPEDADALEVLCDVYKALGRDEDLARHTRSLAKIYRERGDQDKARELAQRVPMSMDLADDEDGGPGIDQTDSAFLGDDELLHDDFLAAEQSNSPELAAEPALDPGDELELELDDEAEPHELVLDEDVTGEPAGEDEEFELSQEEDDDEASGAPLPEGDPEQLLAEASVYLRYGKRDQAIASLRAVLVQEPEHRAALEKLGDALADSGDEPAAVDAWRRAAACAAAENDVEGFEVLRDRIAALDAEAAASLEGIGSSGVDDDEETTAGFGEAGDDFEIDVSMGDEGEEEIGADDAGIEIGGNDDLEFESVQADAAESDDGFEIDVDVEMGDDSDDEEEAAAGASASSGGSSTASQQVADDLEEAEFYFQQDMLDEAEAIYRRVLEVAPNHPSAMLRLGELEARRGGDPSAEQAVAQPAAESAPLGEADLEDDAFELDIGDDSDDLDDGGVAVAEDSTEVAEISLDDDEAEEPALQMDLPPASPGRAEDTMPFDEAPPDLEADAAADALSIEDAEPEPLAAADDEGGGFDLAAELRGVIEEGDDPDGQSASGGSTVEDGFESIFADFKQGVSATLSEDDYETRYDLGIAYREMELYEDAIGEFRMCLESPSRKISSLHMMGLCALDLGRGPDAVNHLEQALSAGDLPQEQIAGMQFDLGRALEAVGDPERARSAYEAALAADSSLPGVQERIQALEHGTPAKAEAGGDDGFESFDDLMAEAGDDATEQAESFESFDDVITAVEDDGEAAPELVAEPVDDEADAEEGPGETGTPGKKRKKKISFV